METNAKQQVVERVKAANNVLVTVSSSPTVDQLASAIGFTLLLNKLGKHSTTVFSGEVPPAIDFLQPEKTIEKTTDSLRDFIISLDKAKADKLRYKVEDEMVKIFITPYRTSITQADLEFGQGDFNVDVVVALGVLNRDELDQAIMSHGRILHDATVISLMAGDQASNLGSINWQDGAASSLCEMLVSISEAFGSGLLDTQISTSFLTGIVAETERFKNAKTTPKVLTMSAQLVAAGANQQLIAAELEAPPPPPLPAPEPDVLIPPEHEDALILPDDEHEEPSQPEEQAPPPPRTEVDVSLSHEEPLIGFDMPDEQEAEPVSENHEPDHHDGAPAGSAAPADPATDVPALDYSVHDAIVPASGQADGSDATDRPEEHQEESKENTDQKSGQSDHEDVAGKDQPKPSDEHHDESAEAGRAEHADEPAKQDGQPEQKHDEPSDATDGANDGGESKPAESAESTQPAEPEAPAEPVEPPPAPDLGLIEISHEQPGGAAPDSQVSAIQIDEHGNIIPGSGYEMTPTPPIPGMPPAEAAPATPIETAPPVNEPAPAPIGGITSGVPEINLPPSDTLGNNGPSLPPIVTPGPQQSEQRHPGRGLLPSQPSGDPSAPAMSGAMEDSRNDPPDTADILNLPPLDGRGPEAAPQPSIVTNPSREPVIQPTAGAPAESIDDARNAVMHAIGSAPYNESRPEPIQALNAAPMPAAPGQPQGPAMPPPTPNQFPQPIMPPVMGMPQPNIISPTPGGSPPPGPPPIMPPIITNHGGTTINVPPQPPA